LTSSQLEELGFQKLSSAAQNRPQYLVKTAVKVQQSAVSPNWSTLVNFQVNAAAKKLAQVSPWSTLHKTAQNLVNTALKVNTALIHPSSCMCERSCSFACPIR